MVTNKNLKGYFKLDNVSQALENLLSGNMVAKNVNAKDTTHLAYLNVNKNLNAKGSTSINSLEIKKLKSHAMTVEGDQIVMDPDMRIKLKNSLMEFKVKEIFDVIVFMKYIVTICGSKLEKCDFRHLLMNYAKSKIQDGKNLRKEQDDSTMSDDPNQISEEFAQYMSDYYYAN